MKMEKNNGVKVLINEHRDWCKDRKMKDREETGSDRMRLRRKNFNLPKG